MVLGGGAVSYERGTPVRNKAGDVNVRDVMYFSQEREFFIDNLLVRIHYIIVMIKWTGLAPWEFEFPFPGSLTSTFLGQHQTTFERQRQRAPEKHSLVFRAPESVAIPLQLALLLELQRALPLERTQRVS